MSAESTAERVAEIERLRAEVARLEEERASTLTGMRAAAEYHAVEMARLTAERDADRVRWHARLASAHGREEKLRAALADTPENRDCLFGRGCADMETAGLALRALRERAGIE